MQGPSARVKIGSYLHARKALRRVSQAMFDADMRLLSHTWGQSFKAEVLFLILQDS